MLYISKIRLSVILLFIVFSFLGRLVYPFGDEPDFLVRAGEMIGEGGQGWSSLYFFRDWLNNFNLNVYCQISAGPLSLWASIDTFTCGEPLKDSLMRLLITISYMTPLFLFIVFHSRRGYFSVDCVLWQERTLILGLSLISPSMVFYLGVFSKEQITLIVSLFLFLFWGHKVLMALIIFIVSTIDLGNSMILVVFVSMAAFFLAVTKYFGTRKSIFLMLALVLFVYFFGEEVALYLQSLPLIGAKVQAILNEMDLFGISRKYSLILRPVITFMTAIFMTPSGIKIIILYPIFGVLFFWSLCRLWVVYGDTRYETSYELNSDVTLLCVAIATILIFIFLFPGYSNFKYYVFLLPFILKPALRVWPPINILVLFSISNIIVFGNLILFSL